MAGVMHQFTSMGKLVVTGSDPSSGYSYYQVYPDCLTVAYQLNIVHTPL